jgi:hypothetical protein
MNHPISSRWWHGVVPFIGSILFLIDLASILDGKERGAALHVHVIQSAVTNLIGWAGFGAGIAHLFFSRGVSRTIGFESGGFQTEVGFCDLSFGIVGLMAASHPPEFWLSIIWFSSLYRAGCGLGHIRSMLKDRNFAINNTLILVIDFGVPAFLLGSYYAWIP